jgi:hypothetical protein
MSEHKPLSKKNKLRALTHKKKPFIRGGSTNTRGSSNNECATNNSDNSDQNSQFQHQTSANSIAKKNSFNDGIGSITIPSLDSSNMLNASQNFILQKLNSADASSNLISIEASRKSTVTGLLKRKSRLIRNATRLSPVSHIQSNKSSISNRKQVSNLNEVEFELDNLLG